MRNVRRAIPVIILGAFALLAAACAPETGSGSGTPKPNPLAVIDTGGNITSGNAPLVVDFDGTGSSDPLGLDLTYSWDFGGGVAAGPSASTSPAATVTFDAGTYTVKLTVTNTAGRSGTTSVVIKAIGDNDGDGFFPPADCNDNDASIYPGAPDPAGDGIDQNCDGVDGTLDAVFVSADSGTDQATCGPISDPCKTIGQGINRAPAMATDQVYVNGGNYPKFNVVNGIDVIGGYGANWQRGLQATGSSTVKVNASVDSSVGGPVGIVANGINTSTTIADLTVQGASASAGQNSYGIHVTNSTSALEFNSVVVIGGTAGAGANGAAGSGGWGSAAAAGAAGAAGFEPGGVCNSTSSGAGGNGATGANNGGKGGAGGTIDRECGWTGLCAGGQCDAQPGANGTKGVGPLGGNGGQGGEAATDGLPWICQLSSGSPVHGQPGGSGGNGSDGAPGTAGAPGAAGGNGGIGTAGSGGGGGGGGGANDCNIDDAGAGGGGGGAGGAAATVGGKGGSAGADSIAIRLVNSSPTFSSVQVTLGTGGNGGNGGVGAAGQPGGAGGAGGAAFDRGGRGGDGGAGGAGGASGVGGGGGGGAAVGVDVTGTSTLNGSVSYNGGQGGAGGTGGNSGSTGLVLNVR